MGNTILKKFECLKEKKYKFHVKENTKTGAPEKAIVGKFVIVDLASREAHYPFVLSGYMRMHCSGFFSSDVNCCGN